MVVHICSYCPKRFTTLKELKNHLINKHGKKRGDYVVIKSYYRTKKLYDSDNNWITI